MAVFDATALLYAVDPKAPALSEVLVYAGSAASRYLDTIFRSACFRIAPFGERSTIELAKMTDAILAAGNFRAGSEETRAKIKFDRQVIAITRVEGQTTIYSDDHGLTKFATKPSLQVVPANELPLPPTQRALAFE